jgi:photosystem II stability/assembly factor-like uncharacterized protein
MNHDYPPPPYYNRPGLPALSYRLGNYTAIRQRLLSQLTRSFPNLEQPQGVSLRKLTTRDPNDPAIALLDALAVLADVLYFYQERIANEGYLITATELKSVLELTRMVGYQISPGVAASALLAFTVDQSPGSPAIVTIPKGIAIQSLPEQEELPQTFETHQDFVARVEWNALKPRLQRSQAIDSIRRQLYLVGTSTQLQAGDLLLLLDGNGENGNYNLLTLAAVEPLQAQGQTRITWQSTLEKIPLNPTLFAFRQRARLFGYNAPRWQDMPDTLKQEAAIKHGKSIQGGVFLTQDQGESLQSINADLPSSDVRCVVISKAGNLLAGFSNGIFRSRDGGQTWKGVNLGLSNLNIQTFAIDPAGNLLVGTAEGGVFRSKDEGESWTPLHLGSVQLQGQGTNAVQTRSTRIPNTVVRSLLFYPVSAPLTLSTPTSTPAGTVLSGNGSTVRITANEYPNWLRAGAIITIQAQPNRVENTRLIENIQSYEFEAALIVDSPFTAALAVGFTITDNAGTSSRVNFAAAQDSDRLIVTGNGRLNPFATNQTVTIAGITKNIQRIDSYQYTAQLTVNLAFLTPLTCTGITFFVNTTVPLTTNNGYLLVGTDNGVLISADDGQNWYEGGLKNQIVRTLAIASDTLHPVVAGTDQGIFCFPTNAGDWIDCSDGLPETAKNIYALNTVDGQLLAGTQQGIYKFDQTNNRWISHNLELANQTVRAVVGDRRDLNAPAVIFAATEAGVYRYQDGEIPNTKPLTTWGATALSIAAQPDQLLIGTRFVGFVEVSTTPATSPINPNSSASGEEWFNFEIAPDSLDLDTKYPKLCEQSWIVLIDTQGDRPAIAPRPIRAISLVQRNDFAIAAEVTQLQLNTSVLPQAFHRRSTVILAQSEALTLAPDPLTVSVQQANIFFDPICGDRIALNQYVAGLRSQQQVIVSGKRLRAVVQHVGGVVQLNPAQFDQAQFNQTQFDQTQGRWQRLSLQEAAPIPGLNDTRVTALTEYENTLFAGTAGGGIFRLVQIGDRHRWEPANQGLTSLMITAIAVLSDRQTLYAATADQGVFQARVFNALSTELKWEAINRNLVSLQIQTLLTHEHQLYAGMIRGGLAQLQPDQITWAQIALENRDVHSLAFAPNGIRFAGTAAEGVFRSMDQGVSWQPLGVGLTNPNITALVAYVKSVTGTIDVQGTTLIGQNTRFTDEFVVGDTLFINQDGIDRTQRQVTAIFSDTVLRIDQGIEAVVRSFQILRVLAGTAGSGILALVPDRTTGNLRHRWQPVLEPPRDLTIRCLFVHPLTQTLYAGTASGGIFGSIDDGDRWTAINQGLTSLDHRLNPNQIVNTDFQAIALFQEQLVAGGIGILISPDTLYTAPIRGGDRLHVLAPPQPLLRRDSTESSLEQKWLLQDRDGFIGMVMTPSPLDIWLEPAIDADPEVSEIAEIAQPPNDQQQPLLRLSQPLQNSYDPETLKIYANIVPATHGETVMVEVLGSGDGSQPNQQFVLRQKPLTYTSAPTATGSVTTLEIWVNQVQWTEVDSLYGRSRQEQVYITQRAEDGAVTVIFGDGTSGMRLPTGMENVIARYRTGIGQAGLMGRDRLSLLKVRPLGIAEVTNPLPTSGAADPETMAEARASAPLTVRTLGRIVSLQDYEDFARSFAGIGKAQAAVVQVAGGASIHITVAAVGGGAVLPDTPLHDNLIQAIAQAHDPIQQVQVDSCETLLFNLEARLLIDTKYLSDRVILAIREQLLTQFAFEQRHFGQEVTAAEVIATIQSVAGVIAVDLDALYRRDQARGLQQALSEAIARWNQEKRQILPAQLLLINPAGIRLRVETRL